MPSIAAYNIIDRMPGLKAEGDLSTYTRLPPAGRGEYARRLVHQDDCGRRTLGQAEGKKGRPEGQCVPGRGADDERSRDAARLRTRY